MRAGHPITISTWPRQLWLFAAFAFALGACAGEPSPDQRRTELLRRASEGAAAIPVLAKALDDENGAVRRTAVRLLAEMGEPARPSLVKALGNKDVVVRRAALFALCALMKAEAVPILGEALKDADPLLRQAAAEQLVRLEPRTEAVIKLLEQAQNDEAPAVREVASNALWPFFKEVKLLSQRKDWDHEVKLVKSIPLPNDGWRLKTDPERKGHLEKWFEPEMDDSSWANVGIDKAWEHYGHTYDGVAWYRGKFTLPEKPKHLAAELHFGAVDECAWVWINGQYVGQHDIGPYGWDKPFRLDATQELKWGGENQITVRAYDSKMAGGIWKPVTIELLE